MSDERMVFVQGAGAFVSHESTKSFFVAAGSQGPAGAKGDKGDQGDVSTHEAATDPHPQYATPAEASAAAPVQSVAGKTGSVTLAKADVGLSNVDNTSDANKPVSTAQAAAIAAKADASHNHDAAYVNATGDTMTGPLAVTASSGAPFSATNTQSKYAGAELLQDPSFDTGTGWTLGAGQSISGGSFYPQVGSSSDLTTSVTLENNQPYLITVAGNGWNRGTFKVNGTSVADYIYYTAQTMCFIAPAGGAVTFTFTCMLDTANGGIQSISLRKYNVASGLIASFGATNDGTNALTVSARSLQSGFALGSNVMANSGGSASTAAVGTNILPLCTTPNRVEAFGYGIGATRLKTASNATLIGSTDPTYAIRSVLVGHVNGTAGYSECTIISPVSGPNYTSNVNGTVIVGGYVATNATSGDGCTFVGHCAAQYITSGAENAVFGNNALQNTGNGGAVTRATAIGAKALASSRYDYSTGLGYNAQVTGTYQVQLGASGTTTYAYGAVQDRSDRRDKTDIRPTVLGLDFIMALTPVDFRWDMRDDYRAEINPELTERANNLRRELGLIESGGESEERADTVASVRAELAQIDSEIELLVEGNKLKNIKRNRSKRRTRYHHGLIAQDVKQVMTTLNVDFGGYQDHSINGGDDVLSIGYTELISPLIRAVQEQQEQINTLTTRLAKLEKK